MIVIDDREVGEHPEIPELLGVSTTIMRLEAGDYCFLDVNKEPVGIERSEISNLVMKSRSGELEAQMYKCQGYYPTIVLLVEGVYDQYKELLALYKAGNNGYFRSYVYPRTTYLFAIGLELGLSSMGIEVVHSPNFACSMDIVGLLYKQRNKAEGEHTLFRKIRKINLPTKISANPAVPKLMALVPRLSERTAVLLLHKFDTIWAVLNAEDKELLAVEGMGKGFVSKLRESVGKP